MIFLVNMCYSDQSKSLKLESRIFNQKDSENFDQFGLNFPCMKYQDDKTIPS
jgi:hypothetical protein